MAYQPLVDPLKCRTAFRCDDGVFTSCAVRCDGIQDCKNGEDEDNCKFIQNRQGVETTSLADVPTRTTGFKWWYIDIILAAIVAAMLVLLIVFLLTRKRRSDTANQETLKPNGASLVIESAYNVCNGRNTLTATSEDSNQPIVVESNMP